MLAAAEETAAGSPGVHQAAREAGPHIPEELIAVGYDDAPVTARVEPPLTTVHQPLTEMAATAMDGAGKERGAPPGPATPWNACVRYRAAEDVGQRVNCRSASTLRPTSD
ncbi:substrate-binding domain-containing protein [Streptomyces bobili]|uniref:substrate-binding domain-containing protein n=1 Tax=Streptomyces bobili TaxID=67280 RepID=UPI003F5423F9